MYLYLKTALGQVLNCRALDSKIKNCDFADFVTDSRNGVDLLSGDLRAKACSLHLWSSCHGGNHLRLSCDLVARENSCSHCSGVTNLQRDRPGVYVADTNDALVNQVLNQVSLCAEVARDSGWFADYITCNPNLRRLFVTLVGPNNADVRCRLKHNLTGVRRVCDGLLVPGHSGRENQLTKGLTLGTIAFALEYKSVL